jgi:hypothetical protein
MKPSGRALYSRAASTLKPDCVIACRPESARPIPTFAHEISRASARRPPWAERMTCASVLGKGRGPVPVDVRPRGRGCPEQGYWTAVRALTCPCPLKEL